MAALAILSHVVGLSLALTSDGVLRGVIVDDSRVDARSTAASLAEHVLNEDARRPNLHLVIDDAGVEQLISRGILHEVVVPDVEDLVARERARVRAADPARGDFYSDFRDLDAIRSRMSTLVDDNPDTTSKFEIGTSVAGQTIEAIQIDLPGAQSDDKPAVFVTGLMHAREWLAGMTAMCIADRLIEGASAGGEIERVLDKVRFYVAPVVNPDGYAYSWDEERYWRKNRSGDGGVDINRNFGVAWGNPEGASSDPDADDYHGPEAFSEPETRAIRDFILDNPDVALHVDYHAFAELMLYPPGHTSAPTLPTANEHVELATAAASVASSLHGESYMPLVCTDLYPATGVSFDWVAFEANRLGITVEVRPSWNRRGDGFAPPPSYIVPTCEENLAGLLEMARRVVGDTGGGDDDDGDDDDAAGDDDDDDAAGDDDDDDAAGDDDDDDAAGDDDDQAGDDDDDDDDSGDGGDDSDKAGCGCAMSSAANRTNLAWVPVVFVLGLFRRRLRQG